MTSNPRDIFFIIVDDDPVNNSISKLTITNVAIGANVLVFTNPVTGLEYLEKEFINTTHDSGAVILLLNLNMPEMTGWEFLEKFRLLDIQIQNRIKVHILSSSINPEDKTRSLKTGIVSSFIVKPLTVGAVRTILEDQSQS